MWLRHYSKMPRNHITGAICVWLLAGNRISVFVRMGESKPDAPHRIRVDANRVCGLFQRIRNRVDVTSLKTQLNHYKKKKLQQRLHKLISTTLLTTLQSIAKKRGSKAGEQHRVKKKQKLATRCQTALNGAKPDDNRVRDFPSLHLTWLKPTCFCPPDTHWHKYIEHGLKLSHYCILHWGRPVSKSRQIEQSPIPRNFEPTCAAFDTRHFQKYLTL